MKAITSLRSLVNNCHFFPCDFLAEWSETGIDKQIFFSPVPLNASINNKKQLFTTKPRWLDISTEVNFGAPAPEPRGPFCGCFQLASPAPLSPLSHKGYFCNSSVKSHLKPNFKQIWWIFALSSALLSIQFHSKFKNLQPKKHAQLMWDCLSSHCFSFSLSLPRVGRPSF